MTKKGCEALVLIIWINCRLVYNLSDDLCVVMMFPDLYNVIIGNDGQNYTNKILLVMNWKYPVRS